MKQEELLILLNQFKCGELTEGDVLRALQEGPFRKTDLGYAVVDHHRELRSGFGEVIYGESKTIEQMRTIAMQLSETGSPVLATRLSEEKIKALQLDFPSARVNFDARTLMVNAPTPSHCLDAPFVAIVAAGTSDWPVAQEAAEVCVMAEIDHTCIVDVGVAGIQRLFDKLSLIRQASVVIVVAGMEAALPSVIGGLVDSPVIGVPVSVGYGSHLNGFVPLLGMLNSCSSGLTVVNIDNGFGAAFAACQIIRRIKRSQKGALKK